MKRHLNLPLCVALIVAVVVLGASAHFLHAFQVKRTAGFLLQQAQLASEQGDLAKSAGYFNRYLALFPHDAQAKAQYGLLLADEKVATTPRALLAAQSVLVNVLVLNPDRHDIRRRVIQIAMHPWIGRYNDAAENIDRLLQNGVEDAELYAWQARCYEATGDFKKARRRYEDAIGQPKKEEEHYVRLAYLLRRQPIPTMLPEQDEKNVSDVFQTADRRIEELLQACPQSHLAWLLSARYHGEFMAIAPGRERRARDIAKAVELAPTDIDVLLAAAELEQEHKRSAQARAFLEQGIARHPVQWRFYQALARVELEDKNPSAAVATLQAGLEKIPKQLDLLWNLAHLHLHQGQNSEAEALIARLVKDGFPRKELDYLQGRLFVNKEEWIKAIRLLERTYPQVLGRQNRLKDWFSFDLGQECKLLLARCFEGIADPYSAAAAYGQVVAKDPRSNAGRLGLARMEWATGQEEIALREYRQLMQDPRGPVAAWVECAQLSIIRNLRGGSPDWTAVEKILEPLGKLTPTPIEVTILRAEVLAAKQQFDLARDVLIKEHQEIAKRPVEIWVALSGLEMRRRKMSEALTVLDEAIRQEGDHVELRIARIKYWARQGGPEARPAMTRLGQGTENWSKLDQRRIADELARAYFAMGEMKLAAAEWRQIAQDRPNDVGSRLVLFDFAFDSGDEAKMDGLVEELKGIEGPEGSLWRFCLAYKLIWQARQSKNQKLLAEANSFLSVVGGRRPSWHRVPTAQAQINLLLNKPEAALAKFQEAIAKGEQNPAVIRRAVMLLSARGRYVEADELLQNLRDQTGSMGDLTRVAAEVKLAMRDTARGLELAAKAVSPQSNDYRDHLWLGQVLWAADKTVQAEAALRRAIELNKTAPECWVALIQFAIRVGDAPKAEEALKEAHKYIPREVAPVHLAICHELLGNAQKAQELYEEALATKPEDAQVLQNAALFHLRRNQRDQAKNLLNKMIHLKNISPEEAAQARRVLARILASNGDYHQTQEALKILGILESGIRSEDSNEGVSPADLRAQAAILAQQPNPRQRRQAIAILEKLARSQSITPNEQLLQAQLYESVGEWPKARDHYLVLISATQDKLAKAGKEKKGVQTSLAGYLAQYCTSLLLRDDIEDVNTWFAKLEEVEPASFRTLATKARLLNKQGRASEAVAPLLAMAEKSTEFVHRVAVVLEDIGQLKEAELMYQRYVSQTQAKSPESVLLLAQFLGRCNRPNEALDLCEKARNNCKLEAVAGTCIVVLHISKSGDPHWRRVADWLEKESGKDAGNTMLLTHLSAVRRLQKDYPAVTALCRRILNQDKADATAMNNLAWILALHGRDGEAAFGLIERAIQVEGLKDWLLDTRGVVFLKLGKAGQAIMDFEEAIAELPTPQRYFHLAQAHLLANNRSAALSAYHQAKRLGLDEQRLDPLEHTAYLELKDQLERR